MAPWVVVPLIWLEAMCHGLWPLGVIISLPALAEMVIDREVRGWAVLRLAAVPVAAGLLTCPAEPGAARQIRTPGLG